MARINKRLDDLEQAVTPKKDVLMVVCWPDPKTGKLMTKDGPYKPGPDDTYIKVVRVGFDLSEL
jgi:hypothetical protein